MFHSITRKSSFLLSAFRFAPLERPEILRENPEPILLAVVEEWQQKSQQGSILHKLIKSWARLFCHISPLVWLKCAHIFCYGHSQLLRFRVWTGTIADIQQSTTGTNSKTIAVTTSVVGPLCSVLFG